MTQPSPATRNRRVLQNSWVVEDLEQAAMAWVRTTGVGPFFIVPHIQLEGRYRGRPVDIDFSVALAQGGGVQIELIQQHNNGPSAYRDIYKAGSTGFHHIAIYCMDYDRDYASYIDQGFISAFEGSFDHKRFAYIDTSPAIGCMVELIEDSAIQRDFFARIIAGAEDWDGRDPIRQGFPG
jgi:Glyoxalase/Bleomycin resistance protein/Dioxygenase superfamily